jgi:hypothetical protein
MLNGNGPSFFTCLLFPTVYNFFVPPADDFGDWATPKEPTVGHFFAQSKPTGGSPWAFFVHTGFATEPRKNPLSAGAL